MKRWFQILSAMTASIAWTAGCMSGIGTRQNQDNATSVVGDVATKALDIAEHIGVENGFGGSRLDGYAGHMPGRMGFDGPEDLAPETGDMMVRVRNESDRDGTFHLSYFVSHMGLDDQLMDVEVGAGQEVVVEIPCSEIVGMGSLETPGEAGCHLADGEAVDNLMTVPGFLGQDFTCDGIYECVLTPDVDDLDGDGDTEELIILSEAMEFHMMNGGPMGHMHGGGGGMMGPHMGG